MACPMPLDPPKGPVVLEITGAVTCHNGDGVLQFDLEMLRALGPVTLQTTTIWTDGVQQFEGVPLVRLMARIGATGEVVDAYAVNDYWAELPMAEAGEDWPLVAYLHNGEPMSRRGKGPLWVVYPYDRGADFNTEDIYARSIWQLTRLDVRP